MQCLKRTPPRERIAFRKLQNSFLSSLLDSPPPRLLPRSRSAPEAPKPRWASLQIAFETLPKRPNLAGHRSKLLSARSRNAKTSLGIAPNCFRSAPETPKPRWASLQIAFGASPKRKNLAGHRSKLLSERPRDTKTSLGIAPNCFRRAPEAPKPRWASLQNCFRSAPETPKPRWASLQNCSQSAPETPKPRVASRSSIAFIALSTGEDCAGLKTHPPRERIAFCNFKNSFLNSFRA